MILNKATGDIYVSCFTAKVIKVLNQEGEVDIFASMDMHPAGINIMSRTSLKASILLMCWPSLLYLCIPEDIASAIQH
jgi:hypothetical protein